ncbi:protein kinase [Candidatus Woesearchaeota archaeon]|nr:protein kinase [Candidatus Woesearchaeota archaeon]
MIDPEKTIKKEYKPKKGRIILNTFELIKRLGKGGMGSIYEAKARSDIPKSGYKDFISNTIAWREVTGEKNFSKLEKKIHRSRKKLDELINEELDMQESKIGKNLIQETKDKIIMQKESLYDEIKKLKSEQTNYVGKRAKELSKEPLQDLSDFLNTFDVHIPSDNLFAIKYTDVPKGINPNDFEETKRLQDEWKTLITLNHPNLVTVYSGGTNFYVMDLIRNMQDIKKIKKDYSIENKIKIIIGAAKGLSEAHKNGLIHRDVKPANIFVSELEEGLFSTKVGDFGLVKTDYGMTQTGMMMGSPFYMAPEQVRGAANCTELSDIYSLGASLYDLIVGYPPFNGKSAHEIMENILKKKVVFPEDPKQNIPEDLKRFMINMMAKHPSQRPQSMDEVVGVLEDYLTIENKDTLMRKTFSGKSSKGGRLKIISRQKISTSKEAPEKKISDRFNNANKSKMPYIAGGVAALGLVGYLIFGGNDDKKPVEPVPIVKQDYSNIETMFEKLQKGYDSGVHSKLIEAVGKVPEEKRSDFEGYLEKADIFKNEFEFKGVKDLYDKLKEEYSSLSKDPRKAGIFSLKEKVNSLKGKIEDLEVDANSLKFDFEFDKLEKIIDNYDIAKAELAKAEELAEKSKDKRYSSEIEGIKRKALESVKGTEETSLYEPLMLKVKDITLANDIPSLMVDFEDEEDLEYFKKTFTASGKVENGKFNGMFKPKGICSFYFKGDLDGNNVEGQMLYDGKKLIACDNFGNNKEYKVNLLKGAIDELVYRE